MTGRSELYLLSKYSGAYKTSYKDANPMTVKSSSKTVKASKLKKKSVTVKAITVKDAEGKVEYNKVSVNKNGGKFKVNKKNGKITLKKGLKKGKYTVKVRVTAAGDDIYEAGTETVRVKIKVK